MSEISKIIHEQGQAWEDANCGELGWVAEKLFKLFSPHVPDNLQMDVFKKMLSIIENSSGCTGMVFED